MKVCLRASGSGGKKRVRRRVATSVALLLGLVGLAAATSSAPAQAGYADSSGVLKAALYNVTPYTVTLVANQADYGWDIAPTTQAPGAAALFSLRGSPVTNPCVLSSAYENTYWGYMSYRVDVVGGPAEYITIGMSGTRKWAPDLCFGDSPVDVPVLVDVYNTTSPPQYGQWDPASRTAPGPLTAHPQVTATNNDPQLYDVTLGVTGNWTADARSPLGQGFDDALNSICGAQPAQCTFTQTGPLTWGIGAPTAAPASINCAAVDPPGADDYETISYSHTQEATLSVGGGVTASTEVNLFGSIGSKISVSLEAEHEWTEQNTFSRDAKIYVPPKNVGLMWNAPTVGTVTGTMVLKTGTSTLTVTNFRQTRSGVTRDALTPALNVIAQARPMTPTELTEFYQGSTRTSAQWPVQPRQVPTLVPGRGIGELRLDRPRKETVLGAPLFKSPRSNRSATANDCRVLDPQCVMVAGRGGTWVYDDLAVIFGADHRVSGLIYSGRGRTKAGVGVGSGLWSVRQAYPGIECRSYPGITNCALPSSTRPGKVRTVFHFTKVKHRVVCDKVMIYRVDPRIGR